MMGDSDVETISLPKGESGPEAADLKAGGLGHHDDENARMNGDHNGQEGREKEDPAAERGSGSSSSSSSSSSRKSSTSERKDDSEMLQQQSSNGVAPENNEGDGQAQEVGSEEKVELGEDASGDVKAVSTDAEAGEETEQVSEMSMSQAEKGGEGLPLQVADGEAGKEDGEKGNSVESAEHVQQEASSSLEQSNNEEVCTLENDPTTTSEPPEEGKVNLTDQPNPAEDSLAPEGSGLVEQEIPQKDEQTINTDEDCPTPDALESESLAVEQEVSPGDGEVPEPEQVKQSEEQLSSTEATDVSKSQPAADGMEGSQVAESEMQQNLGEGEVPEPEHVKQSEEQLSSTEAADVSESQPAADGVDESQVAESEMQQNLGEGASPEKQDADGVVDAGSDGNTSREEALDALVNNPDTEGQLPESAHVQLLDQPSAAEQPIVVEGSTIGKREISQNDEQTIGAEADNPTPDVLESVAVRSSGLGEPKEEDGQEAAKENETKDEGEEQVLGGSVEVGSEDAGEANVTKEVVNLSSEKKSETSTEARVDEDNVQVEESSSEAVRCNVHKETVKVGDEVAAEVTQKSEVQSFRTVKQSTKVTETAEELTREELLEKYPELKQSSPEEESSKLVITVEGSADGSNATTTEKEQKESTAIATTKAAGGATVISISNSSSTRTTTTRTSSHSSSLPKWPPEPVSSTTRMTPRARDPDVSVNTGNTKLVSLVSIKKDEKEPEGNRPTPPARRKFFGGGESEQPGKEHVVEIKQEVAAAPSEGGAEKEDDQTKASPPPRKKRGSKASSSGDREPRFFNSLFGCCSAKK